MVEVKEFKSILKNKKLSDIYIVQKYITFGNSYVFESEEMYFNLKKKIADNFQLTPSEVIMVGSAKLGFSINPKRLWKAIDDDSDMPETPKAQWTGMTVCFTGECACCIRGQLISREVAMQIASEKGLLVMPSVTKKLDLLVVADPNTQSGKANKARQYGIRIVHEPVFWRSLGIAVD